MRVFFFFLNCSYFDIVTIEFLKLCVHEINEFAHFFKSNKFYCTKQINLMFYEYLLVSCVRFFRVSSLNQCILNVIVYQIFVQCFFREFYELNIFCYL